MIAPDAAAMSSLIKMILSMTKFTGTVAGGNSLTGISSHEAISKRGPFLLQNHQGLGTK